MKRVVSSLLLTRGFRTSVFARAKIVEVVPPLGESITEGSISKWMKAVGDQIRVDDVIVVVETDKVTVDIKSMHNGVLTRQISADTVYVGKDLYEVDTDGVAAAAAATSAAPAPPAASASKEAPSVAEHTPAAKTHGARVPLIKFIGKRKHEKVQHKPSPASPAAKPTGPTKPQTGVDFFTLSKGAWYGRPALSAKEIAAIESGGAF